MIKMIKNDQIKVENRIRMIARIKRLDWIKISRLNKMD